MVDTGVDGLRRTETSGSERALDGAAWVLTELFTPAVSVIAISVLCGAYGGDGANGFVLGVVLGACCGLIPYVTLEVASRRKRISDRHVTEHKDRPWAYMVCLASVAVGLVALVFGGAPSLLIWAAITMAVGLLVAGSVTAIGPKVSMHAFCLVSLGVLLAHLSSPWWLLALAVVLPLVVWSRLRLGHHSPIEVAWGTVLGALVMGVALLLAP